MDKPIRLSETSLELHKRLRFLHNEVSSLCVPIGGSKATQKLMCFFPTMELDSSGAIYNTKQVILLLDHKCTFVKGKYHDTDSVMLILNPSNWGTQNTRTANSLTSITPLRCFAFCF